MIPNDTNHSRFRVTTRRALLARQAAVAALVVIPGVACGNNDAEVFSSVTLPNVTSTLVSDTVSSGTVSSGTVVETTVPPGTVLDATADTTETTAAATVPEPAVAPASSTFPAGAELAVSFTFAPSSSGRVSNPYIAVWVEDSGGNLVKTVSLWFKQGRKGTEWLDDLRQWSAVSGAVVDETTSGATRIAGDYTVVWDGTGVDGAPVAQGDYVLYVEAAREDGPYEITGTPITVGNDGFAVAIPDSGELSALSAALVL